MRHIKFCEIHDHPQFPAPLRNLVTDGLGALWAFSNTYKPILSRLRNALDQTGTRTVLDLCSGGGGPWRRLAKEFQREQCFRIEVCLSDKYPNRAAFERMHATEHSVAFESRSVDATRVPADLGGFRTIFSAFHHFGPDEARGVLSSAVECNQGIGIFEAPRRSPRTMLTLCFVPVIALLLAPAIRPFRWSRLFWTYLVPVVPFVLWYDGFVSCLRAYSREELSAMVRDVATDGYEWQVGEEQSGWLPITYLIGSPRSGKNSSGMAEDCAFTSLEPDRLYADST
jgi:hypothetical protein